VIVPRGVLVTVGLGGDIALPMNQIVAKEIDLRGTFRFHPEFATAVQVLSEGLIDGKPVITGVVPASQALQAFISRQLLGEGWSQRINALESLLSEEPARHAFRSFFQTLLPRVLEAGRHADAQQLRWAIEDAWSHESVLQRWTRFVRQLTAAQCEQLVAQAASAQLSPQGLRIEHHDSALSTEGWCLDTRGHVPPGDADDTRSAVASAEPTLH
jgi:hypothetical protein